MAVGNNYSRRKLLMLGAAAIGGGALDVSAQPQFPSQSVRLILPLPAGGTLDAGMRALGNILQEKLKQSVVVENKPGGSYEIGLQAFRSAPANGHILFAGDVGMITAQILFKRFDILEEFTPITRIFSMPNALYFSEKAPFSSIDEMIEWGKKNPGKLKYGSVATGAMTHLLGHALARAAGVEALHVPYNGGPQLVLGMLRGDVHFMTSTYGLGKSYIDKGQMRLVGFFGDRRYKDRPEIPTLKEIGLNVQSISGWVGMFTHKGISSSIVQALHDTLTSVANSAAMLQVAEKQGTVITVDSTPSAFSEEIKKDLVWMGKTIKDANVSIN